MSAAPQPGEPPLHHAARIGDEAAIRSLVSNGADINQPYNIDLDPSNRPSRASPLMIAAGSGDGASLATVNLLLQLGADPELVLDGETAATFACTGLGWWYKPGGDAQRLAAVLEAGSPLPTDLEHRNELLCSVAGTGDPNRLRLLLDKGFPADGHFDSAKARAQAVEFSTTHMKRYINKWYPQGAPDDFVRDMEKRELESIEEWASAAYHTEIPLFRAAASGSAETVRLLLAAGADATRLDMTRQTAMHFACTPEIIDLLRQAGGDIEARDKNADTPLHRAVSDDDLRATRALLQCGANPNATSKLGWTVLMSAIFRSVSDDLLQDLLAAGANPRQTSELGYTLFHVMTDDCIGATREARVIEQLRPFLSLGVNIEQRNKAGDTPLARAITRGNGVEVRVLCALGANPNDTCTGFVRKDGACTRVERPLLVQVAHGVGDIDVKAEALLLAGANSMARDADGFSALEHLVSDLCGKAKDRNVWYQRFYDAMRAMVAEMPPLPRTREEFIATVSIPLRRVVDSFEASLPSDGNPVVSARFRAELLNCIVIVCAHQWWADHETTLRTATPPTRPGPL